VPELDLPGASAVTMAAPVIEMAAVNSAAVFQPLTTARAQSLISAFSG